MLPSYLPADKKEAVGTYGVQGYEREQDEEEMLNLLSYYRHKLDTFEQERLEWLAEQEQMRQNIENFQADEMEVFKKKM